MNKRLIAISIYLLAGLLTAFAQGSIDSKVEVERSYEGDILRVAKMPLRTALNDSIFNFNLNFDYSTFYRPYSDLYELSSAVTAAPLVAGKIRHQWLYADISAAYPLSPKADIYIAPRLGNRFTLQMSYNHYSYWGNVPYTYRLTDPSTGSPIVADEKIPGDRMINRAGALMAYRWRTGEVSVWGKYSSNYYAYNLSDGLSHKEIRESMSHTFDLAQAAFRLRSTNPNPNAFYYDALVRYNYFNQVRSIADVAMFSAAAGNTYQHSVDWNISLGATFKTYHKIFLNHKYKMANSYSENDTVRTPSLWSITPTYRWEKGRWGVDAGLAIFSSWEHPSVIVFPDVYARFAAVPNALWINAKLGLDYQMYTFYDQASLNPWFETSDYGYVMGDGELSLGLEGLVRDRFSYTFNVGYHRYENMLAFAFNGIYQSCNPMDNNTFAVALDATLKWQSKDFYASVDAGYRYFTEKNVALMIPAFRLKAVVEYNLKKRFFISADVLYHTSSTGLVMTGGYDGGEYHQYYRVPGFVDLGAKLTYVLNNKCSIYLDGNNLLNQKIQYFLNYYEPGVNVSAGVIFSF